MNKSYIFDMDKVIKFQITQNRGRQNFAANFRKITHFNHSMHNAVKWPNIMHERVNIEL